MLESVKVLLLSVLHFSNTYAYGTKLNDPRCVTIWYKCCPRLGFPETKVDSDNGRVVRERVHCL